MQYVVSDPGTGRCALVDPVLDYDEKSGATASSSADALLAFVSERKLTVEWILDTHPHADHFSARILGRGRAKTAIGERVTDVQRLWKEIYNLPPSFRTDGSQWYRLFADGDIFHIGDLEARVLFFPGHTLASVTYVVGDVAFIHDTLLMPDFGTARCDFPGGDAHALWRTIERILALPDHTPCSRATTTCPEVAVPPGKAPWLASAPRTFTLPRRAVKRSSLPFATRAMQFYQCRSSFCTLCRSISQEDVCLPPMTTAGTT